MTSTPHAPVIRTQSDLERVWRVVMGPLGFAAPSLWMMVVGADDRPLPRLVEISGAVEPPDRFQARGLVSVLAAGLEDHPGGRWAFLRTRPGRGGPDERDRAWARALLDACRTAGVPGDVVHLATDEQVVPLLVDPAPVE